jgi:hypothetical protein
MDLLPFSEEIHVGFTFLVKVTPSIFTHPNFAFPLPLALPPLRIAARLPHLREHGSCQRSQHAHYGYYQRDPRWHSSHVHILTATVGRTGVAVQRVAYADCKSVG